MKSNRHVASPSLVGRVTPGTPRLPPAGAKFPRRRVPDPLPIKTLIEFPVPTLEFGFNRRKACGLGHPWLKYFSQRRRASAGIVGCRTSSPELSIPDWSLDAGGILLPKAWFPWQAWHGVRDRRRRSRSTSGKWFVIPRNQGLPGGAVPRACKGVTARFRRLWAFPCINRTGDGIIFVSNIE
jgi:hypothetical protein